MMKRLIFILIYCAGSYIAQAQSETKSFNVDGIKVIFKPTSKSVINIRLYFRGGVTNYMADKAGIETMTLEAVAKCGSKAYNKNALRDSTDKYGVSMYGESTFDYGFIQLNCISKYFDKVWNLFSDAALNPAFDAGEFKLLRDRIIAANRIRMSDPQNRFDSLQMQNVFKNTPYAINPLGTEETLNRLTPDDLKNYYKTLLNKNKIFIVVVGNIDKQELYNKILLTFGNIPEQPYLPVQLETPVLNDNKLLAEDHPIATNYVGATINAPQFTSRDYVPFRIGMTGFGGNLYAALKTTRSLSYSPDVATVSLRMPYVTMHAGTNDVQEVTQIMLSVLRQIKVRGVNDEWLQHIKNIYITRNYFNAQSAASITNDLGLAEVLGGWEYADHLTYLVNMTTVEQVNNALITYISGLRWTFVGNTGAIQGFKMPAY